MGTRSKIQTKEPVHSKPTPVAQYFVFLTTRLLRMAHHMLWDDAVLQMHGWVQVRPPPAAPSRALPCSFPL